MNGSGDTPVENSGTPNWLLGEGINGQGQTDSHLRSLHFDHSQTTKRESILSQGGETSRHPLH